MFRRVRDSDFEDRRVSVTVTQLRYLDSGASGPGLDSWLLGVLCLASVCSIVYLKSLTKDAVLSSAVDLS